MIILGERGQNLFVYDGLVLEEDSHPHEVPSGLASWRCLHHDVHFRLLVVLVFDYNAVYFTHIVISGSCACGHLQSKISYQRNVTDNVIKFTC